MYATYRILYVMKSLNPKTFLLTRIVLILIINDLLEFHIYIIY